MIVSSFLRIDSLIEVTHGKNHSQQNANLFFYQSKTGHNERTVTRKTMGSRYIYFFSRKSENRGAVPEFDLGISHFNIVVILIRQFRKRFMSEKRINKMYISVH